MNMLSRILILLFLYPLMLFAQVGDTSAYARLNDLKYLKAFYRLEGDARDYSGWGRHGAWSGTEVYQLGQFGKDYSSIVRSTSRIGTTLNITTNYLTLSAWIIPKNAVSDSGILGAWAVNKGAMLYLYGTPLKAVFEVDSGSKRAQGTTTIQNGIPYHLAGVFSNGTAYIYVNGKIEGSISSVTISSVTNIDIGTYQGTTSKSFTGLMSNARIYNIALTASEVAALYDIDSRPSVPQIALEQPFDTLPDKSDPTLIGAWLNSATWQANDYSANARNGTATSVQWDRIGGRFNGTSSFIECSAIPTTNNYLTVYATVKPNTISGNDGIIGNGFSAGGFWFTLTTGKPTMWIGSAATNYFARAAIPTDKLSVLCCVISNNYAHFYTNGSYDVSRQFSASLTNAASLTQIGIDGRGSVSRANYFDGLIKDVRVYSEAKSAAWVAAEYKKSVPDDSILFWLSNGEDKSRYKRALTKYNVVTGNGPMKFDGKASGGSYISTPDFIGTNDFTAMVWFRANGYGGNTVGRVFDNGKTMLFVYNDSGTSSIVFSSNGSSYQTQNVGYVFPQWVFATVSRSGTNLSFYVNGLNLANTTTTTSSSSSTLVIGNYIGYNVTFNGLLSDLIIWNRVLTPSEIKTWYDSQVNFYK